MNMTLQQVIDALSLSIQILSFKAMYRQGDEAYDQAIAHCEMKQLAKLSFKQQCKILIMINTILLECSKPKQSKLQRDQIKRHELDKARAVFKLFKKADSLKSEDKEMRFELLLCSRAAGGTNLTEKMDWEYTGAGIGQRQAVMRGKE